MALVTKISVRCWKTIRAHRGGLMKEVVAKERSCGCGCRSTLTFWLRPALQDEEEEGTGGLGNKSL